MLSRSMLRVQLFGFVSYVVDDGDEVRLTDLRFPRVLAYLAVQGNAHPTKAAVRSAVWGRMGAEDNLRRALRALREQHPRLAAYIREEGRTIGIEPAASVHVDVLAFAGLTQARRYDAALREVRGGFMADIPDELSAWVNTERRRWNGQAARVCEMLAARDWHEGRPETAIELARRWKRLRPGEQAAAMALASYLAASGEVGEALANLRAFRAELQTLSERDVRQLDDALTRLQSGKLLDLPKPPVFPNGSTPARPMRSAPPARTGDDRPTSVDRRRRNPRRFTSRADEALRDEYRLAGWVQEHAARRNVYFDWCDSASRQLTQLANGVEPKPESLVWTLVAALGEDESFTSHVRERGGLFLTDDGNWHKLYRAAAVTILEEYLDEVEKGTWP
jgi:DNA-binding SARP family transcriptional activator